jgi:hypothetical protein
MKFDWSYILITLSLIAIIIIIFVAQILRTFSKFKKETFTIDNLKDILQCESMYPDGLLIKDIGKSYENDVTNSPSLYDPYIELSPKLFQKILDSFVEENTSKRVSSYESLQNNFNDWFLSFILHQNDPLLVDRKETETLKFFFSKDFCKLNSSTKANEYDLRCFMYRKERSFGYIISWTIREQTVIKAKVNSVVNEDRISLFNRDKNSHDKYSEIGQNYSLSSKLIDKSSTSLFDKSLLPFLSSTKEEMDDSLQQGYSCYYQDNQKRKFYCESSFDLLGARKEVGAWDKPCQTNTDCPYYRKNLNYPNNRGGCLQGICEMPVNIPSRGPTYVDKNANDAYCVNCDKNDDEFKCCKQQMEKTRPSYSLMASPDYAFVNDYLGRKKYEEILTMRNLKV